MFEIYLFVFCVIKLTSEYTLQSVLNKEKCGNCVCVKVETRTFVNILNPSSLEGGIIKVNGQSFIDLRTNSFHKKKINYIYRRDSLLQPCSFSKNCVVLYKGNCGVICSFIPFCCTQKWRYYLKGLPLCVQWDVRKKNKQRKRGREKS